jgi:putative endopeptidase
MKIPILTATLVAAILAGSVGARRSAEARYGAWGFDLTARDTTVKPGNDFNRYANGGWLARTSIPPDKAIVSLRGFMSDTIQSRLHDLMERAATAGAGELPRSLEGKVGAFYAAFMDSARVDSLGAGPIMPELAAIRGARDRRALAALMGRTQTDFEGSIFAINTDIDLKNVGRYAIYLNQAGLGLPDRDYYLEPTFAAQRSAYKAYVARLLTLIGWPDAEARAADIVAFETRIARVSWTKAQQRDPADTYNPVTPTALGALAPGFDWRPFLASAGIGRVDRVIAAEKSAFPRIASVYASTPVEVVQAWLAFTVADNAAFYLSAPFSDARFAFRDRVVSGQPEQTARWKRAIRAVSGGDCGATGDRLDCFGDMGFGVGQLYTAAYFPPPSKAAIEALVGNVKAAMRARLERVDWMSPSTKAEALRKLDTYQIKVGYPDHPRAFEALVIQVHDLIGDVRRAAALDWRFYLDRLNGPVDRTDWTMTPQTNDAYNGSLRDIVFPAGILQAPEFDAAADPAINYGAIGFAIGHELTHGFDDKGRLLDASGALRDWWTPGDAAAFKARARRLAAQFSRYEPVPGAHINGDLTLGENIADLGGLSVALDAYHQSLHGRPAPVIDGYTGDQRVFLGQAQAWRGKARDDYVRKQVVSDPHAPRAFRVIGPTRNVDAWYAAFGVQPGDAYYLPPDQRARIW